MTSFLDYLKWYNNRDVEPFVEAIEKMLEFYKSKGINLFKDALSIPGIANDLLFKSIKDGSGFYTFEEDSYRTFRNNIVGGPSIIFKRHAEVGKTTIRNGSRVCKNIIGYDANALYLWAIGQEIPSGKFILEESRDNEKYSLINSIKNGEWFGFVEVDISVPTELKDYFSEMCPFFKNAEIQEKDLSERMKMYLRDIKTTYKPSRKLIISMKGEKILLYTPLLRWYLQKGLIVSIVYQAIKFTPKRCFYELTKEISDARRAGDINKSTEIIGDTCKLIGNSLYGKQLKTGKIIQKS